MKTLTLNNDQKIIYIGCNKSKLYGRIFGLILLSTTIGFISFVLFTVGIDFNKSPAFIKFFFFPLLGIIYLLLILRVSFDLFLLSTSVEMDYEKKNILLNYFLKQPEVIEVSNIAKFSEVDIATRYNSSECILIYTKDNKKHLLGEYTLKEWLPIKKFLEENQIEFIGHEKFNIDSYSINNIKSKK